MGQEIWNGQKEGLLQAVRSQFVRFAAARQGNGKLGKFLTDQKSYRGQLVTLAVCCFLPAVAGQQQLGRNESFFDTCGLLKATLRKQMLG